MKLHASGEDYLETILPCQNHLVVVTLITTDKIAGAVHFCSVGNAQRAIRETGIGHGGIRINSFGGIQVDQTGFSHFNGHNRFTGCGFTVIHGKFIIPHGRGSSGYTGFTPVWIKHPE